MVQIAHTKSNDSFRNNDTETLLTKQQQQQQHSTGTCPRRLSLGWTHLLLVIVGSLMLGVGFTMQFHCNDSHPISLSTKQNTHIKQHSTIQKNTTSLNNPTDSTVVHSSNNNNTGGPKVAWLMSFPNSGTSFTSKMVRHLSHQSTASNYGEELLDKHGKSIPMFAPNTGPFWIDPQNEEFEYTRPTTFALTKTHCGGRCEKCGPSKYVENPHSFLTACLSGKIARTTNNGEVVREVVTYDKSFVERAVHLIRSPFDNVVSRFHLELHGFVHHNDTQKLQMYPSSRVGFRKFCRRLNKVYEREEESSRLIDTRVFELMRNVPCRDDFFRWVQWHNLAMVTTSSLKIPTLVVHYESYDTHYNETANAIFDFLELPKKGELIEFVKGKEYIEYFTMAERGKVKQAMEMLALSSTWQQISHYFE